MHDYLVYMTVPNQDSRLMGAYGSMMMAETAGLGAIRAHVPGTRVYIMHNGEVVRDNQAQKATRKESPC